MSKETTDTLGNQKKYNYALRENMTRDEFIVEVTRGLAPPPAYFPQNVSMNKEGYESIDQVITHGMAPLSPQAFEIAANESEILVLDTRDAKDFANCFIPNSVNIGINGNFAPWVGALIPDVKHPILLITEAGREEEVVTRLARVGFDNVVGYLDGGMTAWADAGYETDKIISLAPEEVARLTDQSITILDVRKPTEYISEHIIGAIPLPLDDINEKIAEINKDETYHVHCGGGYRSMIFISMLRARGFYNLIDISGGFKAIKDSGKFALTDYVCPNTVITTTK